MSTSLQPAADVALAAALETVSNPHDAVARRAALDAHQAAAMPSRAAHLWRYTDPARLLPAGLSHAPAPVLHQVVPGGVRLTTAVGGHPSLGLLSGPAASGRHGGGIFELLVAALHDGGHVVDVPAGTRVNESIVLRHGSRGAGRFGCVRNLILVGEGAEASVVEEFTSPGDDSGDSLLHAVTEVFLAPGARLVHAVVNRFGRGVRASLVQRSRLDSGAHLVSMAVGLGGRSVKTESSVVLAGEGARSEVLGAAFGESRQHLDHHFFQDHAAPRTESDLVVRIALRDFARSSYTGRLRIAREAPGCAARQENRNLLLSDASRADSIPELEILTHDVTCSHAASTGPLDRDMLFYLRSRGLDESEAQRLIVLGFLEPIFARVPGESLAEGLRSAAAQRMGA